MSEPNENQRCLNCQAELVGKFCHVCGQKMVEPSEQTFKYFIFQFFGSAFFLENNFLKNLWTLLSRPGQLSLDFMEGKRKRWMPPFSLFLLINLFYFWYTPFSDFNLTLREHTSVSPYAKIANTLVTERVEARVISIEEYGQLFDKKSSSYVNSLIVLHVPLLALCLALLFYANNYYYADHFIFALHFLGFILLLSLLIALLQFTDGHLISFMTPAILTVLKILFPSGILVYAWLALHRMYKRKWWATTLTLPVVIFSFLAIHMLFRLGLFLIIFAAT